MHSNKAKGYAHAKQYKRLNKTNKRLKTLLGRVARDIEGKLSNSPEKKIEFNKYLEYSRLLINQNKDSKNKLYSLHSPEVYCVAKGKTRTPYEFGHKVSLVVTHKQGLVLSAQTLRSLKYDGHTLSSALDSATIISGVKQKKVFVDRGYKGHKLDHPKVYISGMRKGMTNYLKRQLLRRSSIEPHIGHMKSDGKLGRNYLKGLSGATLNPILCAIGHNLRMILRQYREFCSQFSLYFFRRFFIFITT